MIRLVCGSRSLLDFQGSKDWFTGHMAALFVDGDILVTGYAKGPDLWSLEYAQDKGLAWCSYRPDGLVHYPGGTRSWATGEVLPPKNGDPSWRWKEWFLFRDAVMVRHVAGWSKAGRAVEVHGFIDPNSRTHGTEYTLGEATKHHLPVIRHTYAPV